MLSGAHCILEHDSTWMISLQASSFQCTCWFICCACIHISYLKQFQLGIICIASLNCVKPKQHSFLCSNLFLKKWKQSLKNYQCQRMEWSQGVNLSIHILSYATEAIDFTWWRRCSIGTWPILSEEMSWMDTHMIAVSHRTSYNLHRCPPVISRTITLH